jgi:hypothetical protein
MANNLKLFHKQLIADYSRSDSVFDKPAYSYSSIQKEQPTVVISEISCAQGEESASITCFAPSSS